MIRKIIVLLMVAGAYSKSVIAAEASIAHCNKLNAIHCVYYTGNRLKADGRYIRIKRLDPSSPYEHIHCTRGGFFDFNLQPSSSKVSKPMNSITQIFSYDQCYDEKCKNHVHLLNDRFTTLRKGSQYLSNPRIFKVHIVSSYGKPCVTWK